MAESEPLEQTFHKAVQFYEKGKLKKARQYLLGIQRRQPDIPEVLHLLSLVALQTNRAAEAVEHLKKAVRLAPDSADLFGLLGSALNETGRADDALAAFEKAVAINPGQADVHYNMGNTLRDLGRNADAAESYRRAVAVEPESADAYFNLGGVLKADGHLEDAARAFNEAVRINPGDAEAHMTFGNTLHALGDTDAALAALETAVRINPELAAAHYNLGNVLYHADRLEDAVASYQKALAIKPDFAEALSDLGAAHLRMGEAEKAKKCFGRMGELDGESLKAEIELLLCLPPIMKSATEIHQHREAMANALKNIGADEETLENPFMDIGRTNFFLAYHNLNDRQLQRGIADMYLRAAPSLNWRAPAKAPGKIPSDRIRIGFLSAFFKNHTIGELNRGLIENLDRGRFEVFLFRFPHEQDELTAIIERSADHVVVLQKDLETARPRIAAEDLDILFYPEIGMDPFTYFLAFSRLAPVQAVSWGHPDTTGIPNIDYFLSSQDLEPSGADEHYSEKLVRLKHLPVFYYRAPKPGPPPGRAHFGLPEDARLYVIAQALFKLHPEFDSVLGALLRADPEGRLVLISGNYSYWDQLLGERFKASFPKEADRVIFVPRMDFDDFMGLLWTADALLDTPYFGGGNTSYEAFSAGIPVVAWPTSFMRGRVTFAQYQAMGIKELIAEDAQTYVDLALRLAKDSPFKEKMKKRIAENSHHLFERHEAVRDMENFFIAAVEASRNNSELKDW